MLKILIPEGEAGGGGGGGEIREGWALQVQGSTWGAVTV